MFSNEPRYLLRKNQLAEVICQLRFPDILLLEQQIPAQFQDAIRDQFPQYSMRKETPAPKITGAPGNLMLENQPATVNYQFATADGNLRLNLTSNFISLSCSNYTGWEAFAKSLDKPLAAFIQLYNPAYFQRIGLRYINFINKEELDVDHLYYRDLIAPAYLGVLSLDSVDERGISRCSIDTELTVGGGCKAKIHAGPGRVKSRGNDGEQVRFVFDLDLSMSGNIAVNHSAGAMQTLHGQAYPLFRGAITDTLFQAMDPVAP